MCVCVRVSVRTLSHLPLSVYCEHCPALESIVHPIRIHFLLFCTWYCSLLTRLIAHMGFRLHGSSLTRYTCSAAAGSENAALTAEVLLMQERCRLSEERALADQVRTARHVSLIRGGSL